MALTLTYLDEDAEDDLTGNDQDFTGINFGTASADRYLICAASFYENSPADDVECTMAGISATEVYRAGSSSGNPYIVVFVAAVPTGTAGTISFTNNSQELVDMGIMVWGVTGGLNTTPSATASDNSLTGDDLSNTLVIPTGGCGIGYVAAYSNNTTTRTFSWTNLTERADIIVHNGSPDEMHTGADSSSAGSATRTVTASGNLTTTQVVLVLVAFAQTSGVAVRGLLVPESKFVNPLLLRGLAR